VSELRLALIDDAAALRDLVPAWWRLFERCSDATPFQSPAWLGRWWEAFSPGSLAAPGVWSGDELIALAPLWRQSGPEGDRLLPLGIGVSDLQDVLVDPYDATGDALRCLARGIAVHGVPVLWTELPPGARALDLAPPDDWSSAAGDGESCPMLAWLPTTDVGIPCDDLPAFVPPGRRRKWRMAGHRCARRGITVGPSVTPGTALSFLAELERLHARRWESRGGEGVLIDPMVRRFHRIALPDLLAHGLADLDWLWLGRECVGAYYGLRSGHAAYAYLGGFDPAFEREGLGTFLLGRAIARAAEQGARSFSFLRGREAYKYAWGAMDRPNRWMRWTPPGLSRG
jgi:CelD/BcsL family acetyltransferase involved in cellulose biosynthesis